jgi:hypothetical protein
VAQTREDFALASNASVNGYETLNFVAKVPISAQTVYELNWEVENESPVCVIMPHGNLTPGDIMSVTIWTLGSRDKGILFTLLRKPSPYNPGGITVEKGVIHAFAKRG